MKTALFTGVCTALVTPFLDGKVNYPMLEQLLRRQVEAGIRAIVLCGTTGEAPTLSDEEKLTIFKKAKEWVADRALIIAGTGSNDTYHAVSLSIRARECGADGLLVVSPYYNKATPDGLYAHYKAISGNVDIPVVIYNVPSRTGVDIPIGVYKKLAELPNIAGVKEASPNITKISGILAACPRDFCVWSGNDDMTVPVMAMGGQGVISVVSNIAPARMQKMAQAALAGNYKAASAMQLSLLPLMEMMFCEVNPIPVKEAMKIIGYDCGDCRLPLTPLSAENKEILTASINRILAIR